jgi:hypothetical protein
VLREDIPFGEVAIAGVALAPALPGSKLYPGEKAEVPLRVPVPQYQASRLDWIKRLENLKKVYN